MIKISNATVLGLLTVLIGLGCSPGKGSRSKPTPETSVNESSSVSFLYAPEGVLDSPTPEIFNLTFTMPNTGAVIVKRGELPPAGATVTISDLPVALAVSVTAGLFHGTFAPANQTHTCAGISPVDLVSDQTNSVELECFATSPGLERKPVKIFYKLATAQLSISTRPTADFVGRRDWTQPSLFIGQDKDGQRISLRSFGKQIKLYVGGDIQYISASGTENTGYRGRGETLEVYADAGRLIQALPKKASLKFLEPVLIELNGLVKIAVQFELTDSDQLISVSGTLMEEPWASEFSVASYNVENLFDQTDDSRNSSYGDFRIAPNELGQSSNWGEVIQIDGRSTTFTEAKILEIEKAITSIEPDGPAYINLQEIESKEAIRQLFLVMQKHGYVDYRFTEMSPETETAIGLGVLSKFPILNAELIPVPLPQNAAPAAAGSAELVLRPIFKLSLEPKPGTILTIYNNHWSSKSHPESYRLVYGKALEENIQALLQQNPKADYIVTGDLNCDYNESVILDQEHNDTEGQTAINSILHAQGDEKIVADGNLTKKYNLQYELPMGQRKSAWYPNTDWSSFDQVLIGTNMYDQIGYTYVDNSFTIANAESYSQAFLFDERARPKRWKSIRVDSKITRHELGGYSDHVPVSFRVYLPQVQSNRPIRLVKPGTPDLRDQADD
jgi:exonuclease III